MKQKVVIIGVSYSSRLSLIRAAGMAGYEVTVIVMTPPRGTKAPVKPLDCYSKYVSRVFYCVRKDKHEKLIPLLLEKCTDPTQKVVLIPDADDVLSIIDNNKELLQEHFFFPHIEGEPSSMDYWMAKTHQKQLAKELGLNVTNGTLIEIIDGQYCIPEDLKYPVFPKPLASMNGGKKGMRRCANESDLRAALDYIVNFRTRDTKVLIEDYKTIETEYALLGFSDGKEVVIPGVLEFLEVSKKNPGVALQGRVGSVKGFEELIEKFKRLVLRIGFVGVFDVDFFKSEGAFYFCELNLRYGGSGYAITQMGVNLPAMMVKSFGGETIAEMNKFVDGEAVYVNEKMCMDDWEYGYITLKQYRKYMKSEGIHFISDEQDLQPEREYGKMFRRQMAAKIVKTMLRKR